MPSIKNQIRSLKRLLKRPNIDARVRITTEKRIQLLEAKKESVAIQTKIKKNVKNFRKPRFFDRRRLYRILTNDESSNSSASKTNTKKKKKKKKLYETKWPKPTPKQRESLERDLIYASYFPPSERYITLFCRNNQDNDESFNDDEDKQSNNRKNKNHANASDHADPWGRYAKRPSAMHKELNRLRKLAMVRFSDAYKKKEEEGHIGVHSFEKDLLKQLAEKYFGEHNQSTGTKQNIKKRKSQMSALDDTADTTAIKHHVKTKTGIRKKRKSNQERNENAEQKGSDDQELENDEVDSFFLS
eukprot:g2109.t1